MTTYTVQDLARDCEVSESDAAAFIACLRVYTEKGWSVEAAIRRHMANMRRLANKSADLGSDRDFRDLVAGMVWDSAQQAEHEVARAEYMEVR